VEGKKGKERGREGGRGGLVRTYLDAALGVELVVGGLEEVVVEAWKGGREGGREAG
jgi:hypothetical protein